MSAVSLKRGHVLALTQDDCDSSRWLELKREYLAYRHDLETLLDAQLAGEMDRMRYPNVKRDLPPHLARQHAPSHRAPLPPPRQSAPQPQQETPQRQKRAASPSSPPPDSEIPTTTAADPGGSSSAKRQKRASSPTAAFNARVKRLRTPSPGIDLASDAALDVQGAYPEGCVLWIRNVHENSTRTTLKALFSALLDQLQEGSGKGVEFVDYEKGLDTVSALPLSDCSPHTILMTVWVLRSVIFVSPHLRSPPSCTTTFRPPRPSTCHRLSSLPPRRCHPRLSLPPLPPRDGRLFRPC